jgi:hypothetical protein
MIAGFDFSKMSVGIADCWIRSVDGTLEHIGEYRNCFTNNLVERVLATLLQTSDDQISATAYPKKMLFCTGAFPSTPWDIAIPSGEIEGDDDFTSLSSITSGSSACYGMKTAEWTNSTGSTVTITYLATAYINSIAKDNLYTMTNIEDRDVLNTQTFVVNYTWQFGFDISPEV